MIGRNKCNSWWLPFNSCPPNEAIKPLSYYRKDGICAFYSKMDDRENDSWGNFILPPKIPRFNFASLQVMEVATT
eukprot:scaffold94952_cov31-Attheya_sp.AAC.1